MNVMLPIPPVRIQRLAERSQRNEVDAVARSMDQLKTKGRGRKLAYGT